MIVLRGAGAANVFTVCVGVALAATRKTVLAVGRGSAERSVARIAASGSVTKIPNDATVHATPQVSARWFFAESNMVINLLSRSRCWDIARTGAHFGVDLFNVRAISNKWAA